MERQDAAAGANLHVLGHGRDRGARHRRIRERTTEGAEVALGCVHGAETVGIGELRGLEHQLVFARTGSGIATPERHAHIDWPPPARRGVAAGALDVAEDHDLEATGQGPEQLEHRDVERETRHREPTARRIVRHDLVHTDEEVHGVAMLDHHALGLAGRARRVDHIGEMLGQAGRVGSRLRMRGDRVAVALQVDDRRVARRQRRAGLGMRQHDRRLRVLDHVGNAILGVDRVEGHVGTPGFQDADHSDDHVEGSRKMESDQRVGSDPEAGEMVRDLRRALVELSIGERLAFEDRRGVVGGSRHPRLEERAHGVTAVEVDVRLVPCFDDLSTLFRIDQRQLRERQRRIRGRSREPCELLGDAFRTRSVEGGRVVGETRVAPIRRDEEGEVGTGGQCPSGDVRVLTDPDGGPEARRQERMGCESRRTRDGIEQEAALVAQLGEGLADGGARLARGPLAVDRYAQGHVRGKETGRFGQALFQGILAQGHVEGIDALDPRHVEQEACEDLIGRAPEFRRVECDVHGRTGDACLAFAAGGASVRRLDGIEPLQPAHPERLIGDVGLTEGRDCCEIEAGLEDATSGNREGFGRFARGPGAAARTAEARKHDRSVGTRDPPCVIVDRDQGAGRFAVSVDGLRARDAHDRSAMRDFRHAEGVRVALAEIHRAYGPRHFGSRAGEIDHPERVRAFVATEIGAMV